MIDETEALRAVIEAGSEAPIIFTTGYTCRRALSIQDSPNHFYMAGSMGLASSIGTGLAHSLPELQVIVVDGDGSFLMNPSNTVMIRAQGITNLHHVVLDNRHYASTGNQPTTSSHVDFTAAAHALGYEDTTEATSVSHLTERLTAAVKNHTAGSTFSYCPVTSNGDAPGGRLEQPLHDMHRRFRHWLSTAAVSRN